MAASGNFYASAIGQAYQHNVNYTGGTVKVGLLTTGYTPNLGTNVHWSDILANEASGTGYSAGGATVTATTVTTTAANSWGITAATSTPYTVGQLVIPAAPNTFIYRCVVSGTSASVAPAWPTTVGLDVVDGGVTWTNAGESVTVYSSGNASWSTVTLTNVNQFAVYDASNAAASVQPLLFYNNMGTTYSGTFSTFTVSPDPTYGWGYTTPA